MNTIKPMIYVACLSAYNNGIHHGVWLEIGDDVDVLKEAIEGMLAKSPAPDADEWAIHDYDLGGIHISEHEDLTTLVELAQFIDEHQELGIAVLEYTCNDIEWSERLLEDCYHGEYDSEEDFVMGLMEETTEIPEMLANYIDYESMARDWFIDSFFSVEVNYKTHVFSGD